MYYVGKPWQRSSFTLSYANFQISFRSEHEVHQIISLTFLEDMRGLGLRIVMEFPEGNTEFDEHQNLACVRR